MTMNNMILLEYDPFAKDARISQYIDGGRDVIKVSDDIKDMANKIVAMSHNYDIYDIRVRAPMAFQSELTSLIKASETSQYSESKINVEGI